MLPEPHRSACSHSFPPIISALGSIQFGGNWQINKATIRPTELALLELAGVELDTVVPENVIEASELEALKTEFAALRQEIGESDLSTPLKAILLQELTKLLEAIDDYKVGGAYGIKSAVQGAYGIIMVDREIVVPAKENPLVTRFYDAVARTADVVAVAMFSRELGLKGAEVLEQILNG